MRLGGWSPDGKKILYTIITKPLADGVAFEYAMIIATLHRTNHEVIKFEPMMLPPVGYSLTMGTGGVQTVNLSLSWVKLGIGIFTGFG